MTNPSWTNLSFDVGIAKELGLHAAIIFNHITYWIKHNARKRDANVIDGKVWMYETFQEMADFFGFFDKNQVARAIGILEKAGLIISDFHSEEKRDRTKWYTLPDHIYLAVCENSKNVSHFSNLRNANLKNEKCKTQIREMRPYIYTLEQHTLDISPNGDIGEKNGEEVQKPKKSKKSAEKPKPDKEKSKINVREHVQLSVDELTNLKKLWPEKVLEDMLDTLESYKGSNGKQYKSDYHTMLKGGWVAQKIVEKHAIQEKKPPTAQKENALEKITKMYKHGESYNGAECFINSDSIAFQRGITHQQVKFKDFGFHDQLDNLFRKFGLQNPLKT